MARPKARPSRRAQGIGLVVGSIVGVVFVLTLIPGMGAAGDVASAEVGGELGMGTSPDEATPEEARVVAAQTSASMPWLELTLYLVGATLAFALYTVTKRLIRSRPRRRRPQKP